MPQSGAASSPYPTYDTGALLTLSAAGNVTLNSVDQINNFSRGVIVTNSMTVNAGNITVNVQGKDQASGTYTTLISSSAIAGNGTTTLTVYPGSATVLNTSASGILPAVWRVQAVVSSNGNISGTVGASVVE